MKNFFIVIIIVGVGLMFYFYFYFKDLNNNLPKVEQLRAQIVSDSNLSFSVPTGFTDLKKEELPKDLQILVPSTFNRRSILKLQDGSGKPSYKILLEINENMHDYYLDLREELISKSWSEIFSKRSDLVSVIEFENSTYQIRIDTEMVTNEKINTANLERISAESKESKITILIKSK